MTRLWLELELRRRWRSLAVLGLLVALAAGMVLASVAGARRGAATVDRLLSRTLPATVAALPNDPDFDWDLVRALPEVAAVGEFAVAPFFVEELPEYHGYLPPRGPETYRTVEKPVVLKGRLPDPARADEVAVTALSPLNVGDRITLRLMTPGEAEAPDFGGDPHGPVIPARVVGVARGPWYGDKLSEQGQILVSPALFGDHPANFIGAHKTYGIVNALVRLKRGGADLASFQAGLARVTGRSDIELMNLEDDAAHARKVVRFESGALLAFALAVLVAALVLVGQSVSRYVAAGLGDLQALRASGLTPRQALALAVAAPTLVSVAGALLGAAGAAAASPWMPVGMAALYEPSPGFDLDWPVLTAGCAAVPLLVLAGALASGWFARGAGRDGAPVRRSAVALAAARAGLPLPLLVGARFALEPGHGNGRVPVRPALLGSVVGVLGVLAAFTFSAGVSDAAGHPERFGMTHRIMAYLGEGGTEFGQAGPALAALAKDPDVTHVMETYVGVLNSPRTSVTVYSRPEGTDFPAVLDRGRLPERPDEVALAVTSAKELGADVGGTVTLSGVALKVTGVGFVIAGSHNNYDDGGWLTREGFRRAFGDTFKYHLAVVSVRPGTDLRQVTGRFRESIGALPGAGKIVAEPGQPPEESVEVRNLRVLPTLLGTFLIALAAGAVGHALATAVRRRRHELAVLRALGMTRAQTRVVVVTQATLLAMIGLAFGVPLGLALGRTLWRIVADQTPLFYQPPDALPALLLIGPAALLGVNLLAVWPGRQAARVSVGHVLRTE
ncbi:FtsX-like permease family protein [Nonomuraea angiospora]|uniref:ABC transporter permease n=1 Tax=Nonomuraea angiospora TaxID=46172 RepID=UPI00342E18D6